MGKKSRENVVVINHICLYYISRRLDSIIYLRFKNFLSFEDSFLERLKGSKMPTAISP